MNGAPELSVCIIVRDEAPRLGLCLATLGAFEEIVVLDTGSSDDTVAVAQQHANVTVHEHRTKNLAEARNVAMALCSGSWIAFLDADEWLDDATPEAMFATIRSGTADAYAVQCNTYFDQGLWATVPATRLVRNVDGLSWTSAIHEDITGSLRGLGLTIASSAVRVHHMESLWAERTASKRERNISAIERSEGWSDDSRLLGLLSLEYAALGHVDQARRMLDDALRMSFVHPRVPLFRAQIALIEHDPEQAIALGRRLLENGSYDDAALTVLTRAAYDAGALNEADRWAATGSPRVAHHAVNRYVIARDDGRTDDAEEHREDARLLNPFLARSEIYAVIDPLSIYRQQVATVSGYHPLQTTWERTSIVC